MVLKRDNFTVKIKNVMRQRAGYICSNPDCRKMTIAPSATDVEAVQFMGVCAHITAASVDGSRFDAGLTAAERTSISNGIFLCSNCATIIDRNDGRDYDAPVLRRWKSIHEDWVLQNLNKSVAAPPNIINNNQSGSIFANTVVFTNSTVPSTNEDRVIVHDKEIFLTAESILNEDELRTLCSMLRHDESIRFNETKRIYELAQFYSKTANEFINKDLNCARVSFTLSLYGLYEFFHGNFDKWPYEQHDDNYRTCLSPWTNSDRGGRLNIEILRQHVAIKKSLVKLVSSVETTYERLRRSVKEILVF